MINSNSRWHLAILVGLVALLLAVLNRSADRDLQLLGLNLEADVAAERAEASTPGLPAPARAKPVEAGSERGLVRTALAARVRIRGRLLSGGDPLTDQDMVLRRVSPAPDGASGAEAPDKRATDNKGADKKARTEKKRKKFKVALWLSTRSTGDDGEFEFSNLDPGTYLLRIGSLEGYTSLGYGGDEGAFAPGQDVARIVAVEGIYDLGDIDIQTGVVGNSEFQVNASRPGSLEIESGQAGLLVRVYDQGAAGFHDGQRTDENGEARLPVPQATAIRIDLVDRNGYVLGSTNNYQSYPLNLETIVPIPAVPGTLAVQLPQDTEVQPGEKIQFTLLRNSSPPEHVIIKSLWGNNPTAKSRGLQMSREGIEFLALRAGTYSIKAIRRIVDWDGVLSSPTGGWMHGTAHVYPGQVTTCRLK